MNSFTSSWDYSILFFFMLQLVSQTSTIEWNRPFSLVFKWVNVFYSRRSLPFVYSLTVCFVCLRLHRWYWNVIGSYLGVISLNPYLSNLVGSMQVSLVGSRPTNLASNSSELLDTKLTFLHTPRCEDPDNLSRVSCRNRM